MAAARSAVLVFALFVSSGSAQAQPPRVRVLSDESPIWLQPDSATPHIAALDRGVILDVERKEVDWYGVVLPNTTRGVRLRGYIRANAVELVASDDPAGSFSRDEQIERPRPIDSIRPDPPTLEPYSFAKQGVYVGYRYAQSRHDRGGDFDGGHVVRYEGAVSLIPQLNQGPGMDLVVGYRRFKSSIELRYLRTTHDGTWAGLRGTAVYHTLDSSWKVHILPGQRVQPFVSFEVGFPWLQVADGLWPSTPQAAVRNAAFSGVGAGAGAGLTVHPHPRVGLSVGGAYRYDFFLWSRSEEGKWIEIDGAVVGKGLRLTSGVTFTF